MDEGLSDAVIEVFIKLYNDGLIYRGQYITNWCPRCQTALSDEEAPRKETKGKLYHIRYPLEGQETEDAGRGKTSRVSRPEPRAPGFIEVATTRPETMLGDTAIAVHPKDKRYKKLIGNFAVLPLVNRRLPIIADEMVDRDFGTGAVKITPAHDPADFQMGRKHGLEFINVMTDDAHMINVPEAYSGLGRYDCRSKLIVDLEKQGYLGAIDEHLHNVGHCYRCHTAIEPRLSPQWFVKMKPLAKPAIKAVKDGTITFSPERLSKVYLNWMENIQDWCISRQIWWGHRIPVWYCKKCVDLDSDIRHQTSDHSKIKSKQKGIIVSKTQPKSCSSCTSKDLVQDEDVLDTWFSSWLWPFSTLGWPKKSKDLDYFYPTNTLVTAQEIIFFWVARMVMAGYYCLNKPPFTHVYIHGTVRDITGKKMSKSLGNVIDPLEIIEKYGTDALRYTLITATAIGQDIHLSEERFEAGRNFANKLWNATRYILTQKKQFGAGGEGQGAKTKEAPRPVSAADKWILSRLQRTIERVTTSLDQFLFNDAANTLYDFVWKDFCDWYLEASKVTLTQANDPKQKEATIAVLIHVLETSLRLLHPVMPYVTEELWRHLWGTGRETGDGGREKASHAPASIMKAEWPKIAKKLIDEQTEAHFNRAKAVIIAIRNTRSELNVPIDSRPPVHLISKSVAVRQFLDKQKPLVQTLARTGEIKIETSSKHRRDAAACVVDGVQVVVPLKGLIDVAVERKRVESRVDELAKHLKGIEQRLNNKQFTDKAPKEVVDQTRNKRNHVHETLNKFRDHLEVLKTL